MTYYCQCDWVADKRTRVYRQFERDEFEAQIKRAAERERALERTLADTQKRLADAMGGPTEQDASTKTITKWHNDAQGAAVSLGALSGIELDIWFVGHSFSR